MSLVDFILRGATREVVRGQVCLEVEIATTYADVFDLLGASSRRR